MPTPSLFGLRAFAASQSPHGVPPFMAARAPLPPDATPPYLDDGSDSWFSGMALGIAVVVGLAASALSAQTAQQVATQPQDELPTPIVSSCSSVPAQGLVVYAPPAAIPAPWRWEQNDLPIPAAVAGDEGEWTLGTVVLWSVPPPVGYDQSEVLSLCDDEGVWPQLFSVAWTAASLVTMDDAALPITAAVAGDEGIWAPDARYAWDYDPIWFIDGSEGAAPPATMEEVYALPVLGPPGFLCPPLLGWGADLDVLPLAATPAIADEGTWTPAYPTLWPVSLVVLAEENVLPPVAVPNEEGAWSAPAPALWPVASPQAFDDGAAPITPSSISVDEGFWVNPIPPLWSTHLVRPWIHDTGDWASGVVLVFRLRDAGRPDALLRDRSRPDAGLTDAGHPDATLQDRSEP